MKFKLIILVTVSVLFGESQASEFYTKLDNVYNEFLHASFSQDSSPIKVFDKEQAVFDTIAVDVTCREVKQRVRVAKTYFTDLDRYIKKYLKFVKRINELSSKEQKQLKKIGEIIELLQLKITTVYPREYSHGPDECERLGTASFKVLPPQYESCESEELAHVSDLVTRFSPFNVEGCFGKIKSYQRCTGMGEPALVLDVSITKGRTQFSLPFVYVEDPQNRLYLYRGKSSYKLLNSWGFKSFKRRKEFLKIELYDGEVSSLEARSQNTLFIFAKNKQRLLCPEEDPFDRENN